MSAKPSRPSDPPPPKSGCGEAGLSRRELRAATSVRPVPGPLKQRLQVVAERRPVNHDRTWDRIKATAKEHHLRTGQDARLWRNDADAIVLAGHLPEHGFLFRAARIHATDGMLLSGDDLTTIPKPRLAMLEQMATMTKRLYRPIRATDCRTGRSLGRVEKRLTLEHMPPRSARLLECTDV